MVTDSAGIKKQGITYLRKKLVITENDCTFIYGKKSMGQCLRDIMYTTKTKTSKITNLIIWNCKQKKIMLCYMGGLLQKRIDKSAGRIL